MKKNKNIRMFLWGRFISLIGSGIQMIALPLYILDLTGSGTMMGIFSFLTLVPLVLAAPFSGIIGDRKNRKNIMIAMDLGRGFLIILCGLLAMAGSFSIYILFILQVFISIMDSLFNSSSSALLPDLISKDELIEANSAKGGFDAASMIIGPALGGIIYGIFGIKMVFYINGFSFLISAAFSFFISYTKKAEKKERVNIKILFNENYEAIKFIGCRKGLLQLFTFAMISNFLLSPLFDIVMPYILKKEIGFTSQQYGYIACFYTAGILLGNLGITLHFKSLGLKRLMKSGLIIETLMTAVTCFLVFPVTAGYLGGAARTLFICISFSFIIMGFFNAFVNTPISTNLQNLVPDYMRSRFFSILSMFSQGAIPLGSLLYGILLDSMKYQTLLTAVNTAAVITAAVFLLKACDEAYEVKDSHRIVSE